MFCLFDSERYFWNPFYGCWWFYLINPYFFLRFLISEDVEHWGTIVSYLHVALVYSTHSEYPNHLLCFALQLTTRIDRIKLLKFPAFSEIVEGLFVKRVNWEQWPTSVSRRSNENNNSNFNQTGWSSIKLHIEHNQPEWM